MKNCSVFASLISPSKMILFEKKYQTFDTVFHHQMKHCVLCLIYYFSHSGQGNKRLRRAFCMMLHVRPAEQNNSGTALFLVHFPKWTNVLLMAVINTINTKCTCRKNLLDWNSYTEYGQLAAFFLRVQTDNHANAQKCPLVSDVASPVSLQQRWF